MELGYGLVRRVMGWRKRQSKEWDRDGVRERVKEGGNGKEAEQVRE